MIVLRTISMLVIALLISGCAVHTVTIRSGVSGRVVDSGTMSAIQGADIALLDHRTNTLSSTSSEADGTFSIPPVREHHIHWIGIPIEDYFPAFYTVRISHPGYASTLVRVCANRGFGRVEGSTVSAELNRLPR